MADLMCHDCRRGQPCARCLAEEHPAGGTFSTVHLGHSLAHVPNFGDQEVVAAFARAADRAALATLGFTLCADCGQVTRPHPVGTCPNCRTAAARAAVR